MSENTKGTVPVQGAKRLNIDFSKILIVNERPSEMTLEDYRLHRQAYKAILKLYKREGINPSKLTGNG